MAQRAQHSRGLLLIAAFKLLKGLSLLIVGISAHSLMHRDLAVVAEHWVNLFRVDPNNQYIHTAVERFTNLDARRLRDLSFGTFFYAGMLLTEGFGLAMRQRWAEYLTIIATSAFIPLELYELVRHVTVLKFLLLVINLAVVAYLVWELRKYREKVERFETRRTTQLTPQPADSENFPS
jgi:uncharacterized membrane protein (DUF2068 family)